MVPTLRHLCIPSLPSHCSCHFWHPLHSVLSSLRPQKLLFVRLGATILPYSSAKLRTRTAGRNPSPRPREPCPRRRHPVQQRGLCSWAASGKVPELQAGPSMGRITDPNMAKSSRHWQSSCGHTVPIPDPRWSFGREPHCVSTVHEEQVKPSSAWAAVRPWVQKAPHHCLHCPHRRLPWGRDYEQPGEFPLVQQI